MECMNAIILESYGDMRHFTLTYVGVGVYAKRPILKHTQFGPFSGDLVDSLDQLQRCFFPLMVRHLLYLFFLFVRKNSLS